MKPEQIQFVAMLAFFLGMVAGWLLRWMGSVSCDRCDKIIEEHTADYEKLLQYQTNNFKKLDKLYDDLETRNRELRDKVIFFVNGVESLGLKHLVDFGPGSPYDDKLEGLLK